MGFYIGGFGVRRGFRPYGGVYTPVLRRVAAVGISARGTPWVKVNGKRLLREAGRPQRQPAYRNGVAVLRGTLSGEAGVFWGIVYHSAATLWFVATAVYLMAYFGYLPHR
jgi:hypothetical protein